MRDECDAANGADAGRFKTEFAIAGRFKTDVADAGRFKTALIGVAGVSPRVSADVAAFASICANIVSNSIVANSALAI